METAFSPAQTTLYGVPGEALFLAIILIGLAFFAYIVFKRITPLIRAQHDCRFDRPLLRLKKVGQFWFGQWKHPRYRVAGCIHILIFAGFIVLAYRSFTLIALGVSDRLPLGFPGTFDNVVGRIQEYAATIVFLCMIVAAVRRIVFKPARYAVPERFGKAHAADAIFLLALIALLMAAESMFDGSNSAAASIQCRGVDQLAILSLPWMFEKALSATPLATLRTVTFGAFLAHELTFFFLLCYRPFGIQFHVETSLFSIYFAKLDRGTVKPVRWGVPEEHLDQMKSIGTKTFEDFTWKHMLDFYSCADCGRCSDQCPANAAGRPLSPRFVTIKARDYLFEHFPVFGKSDNGAALIGGIYSEDEIWSCTTCGACEEECPLLIEYIDKIVDLRRGMIDDGKVPQSLQKPLKALESRGNPYGKLEKKRAEWTKVPGFQESCKVEIADGKNQANTLFFVDSVTSYDDRIQAIGRATARILSALGDDFGILGPAEKDSGHEARRFGEELLFRSLRDQNTAAITRSGAKRIVTADPHALNALKHDYAGIPPIEHISQLLAREVKAKRLQLTPLEVSRDVYAYSDPCYLGRHNQVYDDPRQVLDAIPGLKRVEMERCRDRSFCCGGGGLMLFYEPKETERMGVLRVKMAAEAGANVIVTACPFCMVNLEDAIKVSGMENRIRVIDLTELVEQQLAPERKQADEPKMRPTPLV